MDNGLDTKQKWDAQYHSEMQSKVCPLVGKPCILSECIHFKESEYSVFGLLGRGFGRGTSFTYDRPTCKLWK